MWHGDVVHAGIGRYGQRALCLQLGGRVLLADVRVRGASPLVHGREIVEVAARLVTLCRFSATIVILVRDITIEGHVVVVVVVVRQQGVGIAPLLLSDHAPRILLLLLVVVVVVVLRVIVVGREWDPAPSPYAGGDAPLRHG